MSQQVGFPTVQIFDISKLISQKVLGLEKFQVFSPNHNDTKLFRKKNLVSNAEIAHLYIRDTKLFRKINLVSNAEIAHLYIREHP